MITKPDTPAALIERPVHDCGRRSRNWTRRVQFRAGPIAKFADQRHLEISRQAVMMRPLLPLRLRPLGARASSEARAF